MFCCLFVCLRQLLWLWWLGGKFGWQSRWWPPGFQCGHKNFQVLALRSFLCRLRLTSLLNNFGAADHYWSGLFLFIALWWLLLVLNALLGLGIGHEHCARGVIFQLEHLSCVPSFTQNLLCWWLHDFALYYPGHQLVLALFRDEIRCILRLNPHRCLVNKFTQLNELLFTFFCFLCALRHVSILDQIQSSVLFCEDLVRYRLCPYKIIVLTV